MNAASVPSLRLDAAIPIGPLDLACGRRLEAVEQRVTTYGDPANPAVLVAHALTGSSRVTEWWSELAGPGKILDPERWYVIGINALGSCYGSTGPHTVDDFPYVTVRDIVAAQARALDVLGVRRLALVIGASLGGMQALQWALDFPGRVDRAVMVGSHDHQSAMGISLNAIQREAIALDPVRGLRLARKIAMLSYKSDALFKRRHDRRGDRKRAFRFDVEGYLEYQADVFERRMDPRSYVALTEAMDSFDVRGRHDNCHPELVATPMDGLVSAGATDGGSRQGRLSAVEASEKPQLLFIGISSDWLFLPKDVRAAAARFSALGYRSSYGEIESDHGHDAFLAEPQKLSQILASHGLGLSL